MSLRLAEGIVLPDEFITSTHAILAKRRVGKTYTGAVMAEEMVSAGLPWAALDPTGAWWGLRSSADGQSDGLPVVVIGGDHGDLPLEESAGKVIADLVIDQPGYYVLDLSLLESNASHIRFATAFCERLYRGKSRKRDPLHLFVDEADMFAPQQGPPESKRLTGAMEAIVRRGGIRGLGTTLITQRPAVLNKNVLTQLDMLVILRILAPQDKDAIEDYVKGHATPEERAEIMGSLASLGLGEAWLWAPADEPPLLARAQIRERRTFNSSATPKAGEVRVEPSRMAAVDVESLRASIAATIKAEAENDPALLRKRIKELEKKLAAKPEPAEPEIKLVQVPLEVPEGLTDRLAEQAGQLRHAANHMLELATAMGQDSIELDEIAAPIARSESRASAADVADAHGDGDYPTKDESAITEWPAEEGVLTPGYFEHHDVAEDDVKLKKGAHAMLSVLAVRGPQTRKALATRSRINPKGSTFSSYLSNLRHAGFVRSDGDRLCATAEGIAYIGPNLRAPTKEEVIADARAQLKAGARAMFDLLKSAYPTSISREELADTAQINPKGSTFSSYLSNLRTFELIAETRAGVTLAAELMED